MLMQIQERYFNDFRVGMVKNGNSHLVHAALNYAVSQE